MFMVCDILGLCYIGNCNVCMFLLRLPCGVINYNNFSHSFSCSIVYCSYMHCIVAYIDAVWSYDQTYLLANTI